MQGSVAPPGTLVLDPRRCYPAAMITLGRDADDGRDGRNEPGRWRGNI